MGKIWGGDIQFSRVLLLVTDAGSYMISAYKSLSIMYPKLLHVTCLAHGLSRVAEQVRVSYPIVNDWIASVKRVFLKAPSRVRIFKEALPDVPLPPEPVVTRFGTWIKAAIYHAKYIDRISPIVKGFSKEDAASIEAKSIYYCYILLCLYLCINLVFIILGGPRTSSKA